MSNCDKCIHEVICCKRENTMLNNLACAEFKDRDKFIESPVAIGTTLYIRQNYKDGSFSHAQEFEVVGLHLRHEESHRGLPRKEYLVGRVGYGFTKHVNFDQLGKTVFFSEEECEKGEIK